MESEDFIPLVDMYFFYVRTDEGIRIDDDLQVEDFLSFDPDFGN